MSYSATSNSSPNSLSDVLDKCWRAIKVSKPSLRYCPHCVSHCLHWTEGRGHTWLPPAPRSQGWPPPAPRRGTQTQASSHTHRCLWVRCSPPRSLFLVESGGWRTRGPPVATPGTSLWPHSWWWRGTSCCGCAACYQQAKSTMQPVESKEGEGGKVWPGAGTSSRHAAQPGLYQPLPMEDLTPPAKGTATSILESLHFRPASLAWKRHNLAINTFFFSPIKTSNGVKHCYGQKQKPGTLPRLQLGFNITTLPCSSSDTKLHLAGNWHPDSSGATRN